jgi:hypothetical protein
MPDFGGQGLGVAETLGLVMARRAAEILERHRDVLGQADDGASAGACAGAGADACAGACPGVGERDGGGVGGGVGDTEGRYGEQLDPEQFAADEAVFSTVLDAVNECMGRFDTRPASDRWCDALLQLLQLAEFGANAHG